MVNTNCMFALLLFNTILYFITVTAKGPPCYCGHIPVPGDCKPIFRRFYYDIRKKQCIKFVYGGCTGKKRILKNKNKFKTKKKCIETCTGITTADFGPGKNALQHKHVGKEYIRKIQHVNNNEIKEI